MCGIAVCVLVKLSKIVGFLPQHHSKQCVISYTETTSSTCILFFSTVEVSLWVQNVFLQPVCRLYVTGYVVGTKADPPHSTPTCLHPVATHHVTPPHSDIPQPPSVVVLCWGQWYSRYHGSTWEKACLLRLSLCSSAAWIYKKNMFCHTNLTQSFIMCSRIDIRGIDSVSFTCVSRVDVN